VRTRPGDDPVALAERDAALDEVVGEVRGGDEVVGRRRGHRLAVEAARREHPWAAARHSARVSTASKRCSLSSCRSLL
jgi:hypothetical protein